MQWFAYWHLAVASGAIALALLSRDKQFFWAALFIFAQWVFINFFHDFDHWNGWQSMTVELLFAVVMLWASIHYSHWIWGWLAFVLGIRVLWHASFNLIGFDPTWYGHGNGTTYNAEAFPLMWASYQAWRDGRDGQKRTA